MARILIVEDEFVLALNTRMELEDMGHEVVGIADDAESALSIIREQRPDLIVMDIVIQGETSGVELTAVVNEEYGIPVIYGTAHTDDSTMEKVNRTKYREILHKPYLPSELREAIERVMA